MGKGKTTALIEKCKQAQYSEDGDKRFIVVVPLLTEVERIKNAVGCEEPQGKKKIIALKSLVQRNKNIVCTHSLFNDFNHDIRELIKNSPKKYDLYHDEQPNVFQGVIASGWQVNTDSTLVQNLTKDDISVLFKSDMLKREEPLESDNFNEGLKRVSRVFPTEKFKTSDTVYSPLLKYMEDNALYAYGENRFDRHSPANLISFTDIDIFDIYNEVWIFSYLMRGGLLQAYFELNNKDVNKDIAWYHIENNKLVEGYKQEYPSGLMRIALCLDEKYNFDKKLSKTSFKKMDNKDFKEMAKKFRSYLRYGTYNSGKDKAENEYFYTTFKDFQKKVIMGQRNLRVNCFLANNAKATNDYQDRCIVACLCAKFANPALGIFFKQLNIAFDEKLFTLSELVQFIWRSNIRVQNSDDVVYVYIPCEEIRTLFANWLKDGITAKKDS